MLPDLGTVVHARKGSGLRPGKVVGYRGCTMEGCRSWRAGVRWPHRPTLTWPCLRGMRTRRDGSLEIL